MHIHPGISKTVKSESVSCHEMVCPTLQGVKLSLPETDKTDI